MQNRIEIKTGGLLLFLASATVLITIFFEYRIGWIGMQRNQDELILFVFENWQCLQIIWGWQTLGHALFTIAYLVLLKNSSGIISTVWATLFLSSLLVVIAMGLTLGAYYPALEVIETQPTIFYTVSGGIKILYRSGLAGTLFLLIIFCKETFWRKGLII